MKVNLKQNVFVHKWCLSLLHNLHKKCTAESKNTEKGTSENAKMFFFFKKVHKSYEAEIKVEM